MEETNSVERLETRSWRQLRIVGGNEVIKHSHPWVASVEKLEMLKGELVPFIICGGTLINHKFILTAAHCVVNL
jgi:secreted trypsin-like serine protease